MQFDLFTFLASLFNFLVLLALLRVFLFKRVTQAMDAREERIANNWDEAESEKQEAEQLRAEYEQRMEEADEERDQMLEQTRREVDREKRKRLEQVSDEVDEKRRDWLQALESDQQRLVQSVREEVGRATVESTRSALTALAGTTLERQMVERLLEQIGEQGGHELGDSFEGAKIEVTTSSELSDEERERIGARIGEFAEPSSLDFRVSDDLVCGLRMQIDDQEIGWSIADHMAELETDVAQLVESR